MYSQVIIGSNLCTCINILSVSHLVITLASMYYSKWLYRFGILCSIFVGHLTSLLLARSRFDIELMVTVDYQTVTVQFTG